MKDSEVYRILKSYENGSITREQVIENIKSLIFWNKEMEKNRRAAALSMLDKLIDAEKEKRKL